MKHLLCLGLFLLTTGMAYSQSEEWTLVQEHEGVNIYQKTSNCEFNKGFDEERVLLKFENTTNQDLTIQWQLKTWYEGECTNCDMADEYTYGLSIDASSSIEGQCDRETHPELQIFSKFTSGQKFLKRNPALDRFELTNLHLLP